MEAWQNDPVASPQPATGAEPWQSDPVIQSAPKSPDVSGVQRMAQDNLANAANDNKSSDGTQKPPPTPMERTSAAAGMPVDKIVNGTAQPTDINAANRAQYVKALDNGSATDGSDWMQTMLHAVSHVTDIGESARAGGARTIGTLAYPFLSEENRQKLIDSGILGESPEPTGNQGHDIAAEALTRANAVMSPITGTAWTLPASLLAPVFNPLMEKAQPAAEKAGLSPENASLIPSGLEFGMNILGLGGLGVLKEPIAAKLGKEPAAVTPSDINQVIAQGSKNLMPHGDDFKTAAAATGIPERGFKTVYADAGVPPEKIITDMQQNPAIAADVAAGKVPEQYEYLVEQKAALPTPQAEGLHVIRDEATRSFNVVDRDGDHMQGGFNSYDEAKQHIEDRMFDAEERAAIEAEEKLHPEPITEKTAAGEQTVIPGAEKISDKELAERKMEQPLQAKAEQKAADEGLFDTQSRMQANLFDRAVKQKEETKPEHIGAPKAEAPVLPRELSGAKPRYGYGSKQFTLGFDSDIDRALYITAKDTTASKADPRYRQFLKDNGYTDSDITREGQALKDKIKAIAKDAKAGHLVIGESGGNIARKVTNVIPPSTSGKVTSLSSFLKNNGAKFNESGELVSMKDQVTGQVRKGDDALDHAGQMSQQHGYFRERPDVTELQNTLRDTDGGKEHFRDQDVDRVAKSRETALAKQYNDPAYLEHEAHNVGIDTERVAGETERQWTNRLKKALQDFYSEQSGSVAANAYRRIIGDTIIAAEKFAGKLGGTFFQKLADGYVKTFQPELMGDKGKRADAYLAKYKATAQEAENAYFRQFAGDIRRWDKATKDQQLEYIDNHEAGRWNEEDDPEHAAHQALMDKTFEEEKKSIGADSEKGYKENYLPLQFKDPIKAREFFDSPGMTRKYGADWFAKPRQFNMIQDAIRAGFELRTYNPARMVISRLLAGDNMIRTMDLLHDMESSGVATRATSFSVDKRIAKTQQAITDIQTKYKAELENITKQNSLRDAEGKVIGEPTSKKMIKVQARIQKLIERMDSFNKEKAAINLSPQQLKDLKSGFRIIGPDSKAWNIHPEAAPVWRNAMEMKGLYEKQGIIGDAYRAFTKTKTLWTDVKLSLSLFHPFHEVGINLASALVAPIDHLIKGGNFSDLGWKDVKNALPIGDTSAIKAYNTPEETRTSQQRSDVQRMMEGGFVPTMSARDTIHFRENFDKGIAKIGVNNLRLLGTLLQLPGKALEPLYSKWIPNLRSQMYMSLTEKALQRDPALAQDAGRRGEIFREISKNVDRTFGQLNQDTLFWNKTLRDAFNASYISGGWKLAQIYNARGLLQPAKIIYKIARTGEFSKDDVTYNMLHAYAYTGVTLMMGAAINKMLGNPIGKTYQEAKSLKDFVWSIAEDCLFPKTGENNPDGTPVRLNQPAFTKEYFMLGRDINQYGLVAGAGDFVYHGTLLPSIVDTLNNRDFVGREEISNPLDLHQWTSAGWDTINPITISTAERAEEKGSKKGEMMGLAGFPLAGAYVNQSPFEQKVIAKYYDQNPSKDSAYKAKLKSEMHGAVTNNDAKAQGDIEERMAKEGMSEREIASTEKEHADKFSTFAWKKLSSEDQERLIESASPEEKENYPLKSE